MDKYREQSKYCYPGTSILLNHFNIKDKNKLEDLETTITLRQISKLQEKPIYGSFNLKHLQKIHRFIFGDIYPFAGQFREEQISKGTTYFAHPLHLETYGQDILNQLKEENHLKNLDYETTISKLSFYMSELNILHPFREGNGRTQREFVRLLSMKNGYDLDWINIESKDMLQASIKSVNDPKAFESIIEQSMQNKDPDPRIIKQFKLLKDRGIEL